MTGRAAVTGLEKAAERELLERMAGELGARLSQARSLEAQAMMLRTAVDVVRELVRKRDAGVIDAEVVAAAFDALDEGVGRMIELMPELPRLSADAEARR